MLNLFHLKYFRDTASHLSLKKAAQLNGVTQSALSQAIRSLERQLDVDLLHHQRNRIELTEAGKQVFRASGSVFSSVARLKDELRAENAELSGELSVATTQSVALSCLPNSISWITAHHPKIQLKLRLGNSQTIRQWLVDDEVETAVFVEDHQFALPEMAGLAITPWRRGRYVLIGHPASRGHLSEQTLLVTRYERPEAQQVIKKLRHMGQLSQLNTAEVLSWEVIQGLVAASPQWVGLVPDYLLKRRQGPKLRQIAVPFTLSPYRLSLFHLSRRFLSREARLFAQVLQDRGNGRAK